MKNETDKKKSRINACNTFLVMINDLVNFQVEKSNVFWNKSDRIATSSTV